MNLFAIFQHVNIFLVDILFYHYNLNDFKNKLLELFMLIH